MERINSWGARAVGDLFFFAGDEKVSQLIIDAEMIINPPAGAHSWVPSHVGIIGPTLNDVVEAWLDLHESSSAAIHPAAKYDGALDAGALQLYRPRRPGGISTIQALALNKVLQELGAKPYGVLALAGFEYEVIEKLLFGHATDQPIKHATVCSMTGLIYLRYEKGEPWSEAVDERTCSPDVLLRKVEEHQS